MALGRLKPIYRLKTIVKRREGVIKASLRWCLETYRTLYMRLCRVFLGVDKNKIVFSCFNARSYGDNLKPISEALHDIMPGADIVWAFRDPKGKKAVIPEYVRAVDPITLNGLRQYATARVWVDNFTLPRFYKRRMGAQFYLNTWHGDRAFKKIAYDMFPNRRLRLEESCDIMLAGSEFGVKLIKSAFRYKGEILCEGCPRNDILVKNDADKKHAVRKTLGIPDGARLMIYAPTFRDYKRGDKIDTGVDLPRALSALEKSTGDNWLCLFRAHHLALGGLNIEESDKLINVMRYEDMADLLLISDAIITDYSSSAMDFAILGGRVLIYQADIDDYIARNRELYYRMEDTPFLTAKNNDELEEIILRLDDALARENCARIAEYFGFKETGRAAEAAAQRIAEWMR